jgi:Lycopene cyclase
MPEDTDKKIEENTEFFDLEKNNIKEVGKKSLVGAKRWPATIVILSPLLVLFIPLYKAARHSVNWSAAIALVVTFEIIMFLAEFFSVTRQHWIWNPDRIIGPTIFNIPIEEPLLYYWFAPLFLVVLMHTIENWMKKRSEK